jgi:hypothetical protein
MIRVFVVWGAMGISTAWASAAAGCKYGAEVVSVAREGREATVALRVLTSESFGHSGPIAVCVVPGAPLTLAMPWKELRGFGFTGGETVDAEVVDVFNPPRHVHVERILGLRATVADVPPPGLEPLTPAPAP